MKQRTRFLLLFSSLAWPVTALAVSQAGAAEADRDPGLTSTSDEVTPALEGHRAELLQLAFDAASAMPEYPHIKTRSRLQEEVVRACLELGQLARAEVYADGIANWRTGLAHALIALHLAEAGAPTPSVDRHLQRARAVVEGVQDESFIGWRRDRIRVRVAQAEFVLGRVEEAARSAAGAEPSELPVYHGARARSSSDLDLDAELEGLFTVAEKGNYEQKMTALAICTRLHDRFYDDAESRGRVRAAIDALWAKLPVLVRLDVRSELATAALEHEDAETARALLRASRAEFDDGEWLTENRLPAAARLARLLVRAGDEAGARQELDGALGIYDATRDRVVDIYRADALVPVAEAYAALGDRALALEVFARAVEESVENPNSRPRAEDLVAVCSALARTGLAPGDALLTRLREVRAALGDPW